MATTDCQEKTTTPRVYPDQGIGALARHSHEPMPEPGLLEMLLLLLKHKMLLLGAVGIAGVLAAVVSIALPNIYRSTATIIPYTDNSTTHRTAGLSSALGGLTGLTGGILTLGPDTDLTQLEVVLRSRELTHRVIQKYDLMPLLFADDWDPKRKAWITHTPPTEQDAFRLISDRFLAVSADTKKGTLNVTFDHRDRHFAKQMVDRYLTELSESMREASIRDSREKSNFVQEELSNTADALLREKLYTLLANEIANETFARAQKYFGFRVIDPPIVPDADKRIRPKRALICLLSIFAALSLGIFAIFLLQFLQRITETANPEQMLKLQKHLPFMRSHQNSD